MFVTSQWKHNYGQILIALSKNEKNTLTTRLFWSGCNTMFMDGVICVELKMVNFLLGQQGGYTKYLCFLCYWDSRATSAHWVKKDWTPRNSFMRGDGNIKNDPLVDTKQIVFPPTARKTCLTRQFAKALDHRGDENKDRNN